MADRQTIGKLRLPLPPVRKVNCHEALGPAHGDGGGGEMFLRREAQTRQKIVQPKTSARKMPAMGPGHGKKNARA